MNKLGKDIIETYKPYENPSTKLRLTKISQETFEIDDRYEIIDVSNSMVIKLGKGPMELWSQPKTKKPPINTLQSWRSKRYARRLSIKSLPNEP